jgi:hypothetical protein
MPSRRQVDAKPIPRRSNADSTVNKRRFTARRGYGPPFSGKLSPVTPTSEDIGQEQVRADVQPAPETPSVAGLPPEIGGRQGPEPTRFGDWELRGRCIDF